MSSFILSLLFFVTVSYLSGCGYSVVRAPYERLPVANASHPSATVGAPSAPPVAVPAYSDSANMPAFATSGNSATDLDRLAALWNKRTQGSAADDYPIGPGDVLDISVPSLEEMKRRTVRVSGDGTISLPLIGTVRASGLTEEGLREEIRHRLEADFMHNPQVNTFVKEYRSRQVAVMGSVARPGLYNVASGADTILDVISQAGGMTGEAAAYLHFIPAESIVEGTAQRVASTLPVQLGSGDSAPALVGIKGTADPIVVALRGFGEGTQLYLTMPARPGDVIIVPNAGDVSVQGWVERPGSYKVTSGLTVVGVIAAAGGTSFAADISSVKIIRGGKEGERGFLLANLESIKEGKQQDIPVQAGDIIEVPYSAVKIGPYGFYSFVRTIFHVGLSAPVY